MRWKQNQQNQDVSDIFSETKETLLEKKDKLSDNLHTNADVLNEGVKGRMQAGVPGGASSSQWLLSASESSDTDFAPFSLTAASSSVDQKVNWRSRLRFTATDSDAHVQVSCEFKWLEPRQKTVTSDASTHNNKPQIPKTWTIKTNITHFFFLHFGRDSLCF